MSILIKHGTVINPKQKVNRKADVLIVGNKIKLIQKDINQREAETIARTQVKVLDASGCFVTPGLIDIHVHLRDPGFPQKETIITGTQAAAAGGFTAVVAMPNTQPVIDSVTTLEYVKTKADKEGWCRVYTSAAITEGLQGKKITDFEALHKAGAVTFTDDGKTVMDPKILYRAFCKAAELGVPISSHCEDHYLITEGAINRGWVSKILGDPGIPSLGEDLIIARDLLFAEETGAALHIQHVTTKRGVQLIREAKHRGVNVTCEATPHHFTLTDEIILEKGALGKVNPPLRTKEDVQAIIEGLQDGTIDAIATDHAPHTLEEKNKGLHEAPFGLIGLETSVGLTFTRLVHTGQLSVDEVVAKMTYIPAKIMNLPHGEIEVGEIADVTVIDPEFEWMVNVQEMYSRSHNTPFDGFPLKGKAIATICNGRLVMTKGRVHHESV